MGIRLELRRGGAGPLPPSICAFGGYDLLFRLSSRVGMPAACMPAAAALELLRPMEDACGGVSSLYRYLERPDCSELDDRFGWL